MRHILAGLLLALSLAATSPAAAQDRPPAIFTDYEEMRGTLDLLIAERRVADLMAAFDTSIGREQEWFELQGRVRFLFPDPLEDSATVIRQDLKNGFHQELIAYWTDTRYLYVRLFWHERPEGDVVSLSMTFNTDASELMVLF